MFRNYVPAGQDVTMRGGRGLFYQAWILSRKAILAIIHLNSNYEQLKESARLTAFTKAGNSGRPPCEKNRAGNGEKWRIEPVCSMILKNH